MIQFIGSLVGGATLGGIFALVGLGLVLIFRATKVFNFAHGELMLLPAFLVGYFQLHHISTGIAIPVAMLIGSLVGALFYYLVLRRTTGLPVFTGIIATFGLAAILDGLMGMTFVASQYRVVLPGVPQGSLHIAGASVSQASVALAGFTIILAIVVAVLVRFTHLGLVIRAAGQDPVLSSQCGINVRRVHMGSWAVAAALAAIAGIVYGSIAEADTSIISLGLAALPAIVLGGLDSIVGAVVGGMIVGVIEGFTQSYLGGQYVNVIAYTVLLIALLFFPQGLFGTKQVVRA
jgi:branched-chain amino acid transport system permease protein